MLASKCNQQPIPVQKCRDRWSIFKSTFGLAPPPSL